MKTKLLGYIKISEHKDAMQHDLEHDEGYECYTLFFENGVAIDVVESYGSCYSGWTSASWGDMTISDKKSEGFELIKPKKDVFIELPVRFVEKDGENSWDAMVTTLFSTDGDVIAYHTGDGGCQYYSSGVANINLSLFE